MTTPSNDTLAAQLAALQDDVSEIKAMQREDASEIKTILREAMAAGSADRHQLNVRVARLEEQVRIGKWVLGTLGTAVVGIAATLIVTFIQNAG